MEYSALTWGPHSKKHTKKPEKVQDYVMKQVPELKGMSCKERLMELKPITLEDRTREDVITAYRILGGIDIDSDKVFER